MFACLVTATFRQSGRIKARLLSINMFKRLAQGDVLITPAADGSSIWEHGKRELSARLVSASVCFLSFKRASVTRSEFDRLQTPDDPFFHES
jgi:hypothetical protein